MSLEGDYKAHEVIEVGKLDGVGDTFRFDH